MDFTPLPLLQGYWAMSDNIKEMEWLDYNMIEVERQDWSAMEALGKIVQRDNISKAPPSWI